jgi:hypothetical protein
MEPLQEVTVTESTNDVMVNKMGPISGEDDTDTDGEGITDPDHDEDHDKDKVTTTK